MKVNAKQQAKVAARKAKVQIIKARKALISADIKMRHYTHKNPRKALAIAATAGAVLGAVAVGLMKMRKRK